MMCITTRFRLRHFWMMLPMYLTYRGLRKDLKQAKGLIRYAFLFQSPVACCTLSIWESEEAFVRFSNVTDHVRAVRRAKRWCGEIWSGYWRIDAVSKYANQWQASVKTGEAGPGQWPILVPHAVFPWHLVPLTVAEEAKR